MFPSIGLPFLHPVKCEVIVPSCEDVDLGQPRINLSAVEGLRPLVEKRDYILIYCVIYG